ncbi:MAG: hypothetical protein HYV97_06760 [Bdellovibrio sp.]|nr:hypothetical protein [Bdellovibrio sp.]
MGLLKLLCRFRQTFRRKLGRNSGFTLVEMLIAAGMMGGLALALTQVLQQATKGKKDIELRYEYIDVLNRMRMYLSDEEVCTNTFTATPFTYTSSTATNPLNAIIRSTRSGVAITPITYYENYVAGVPGNKGMIDRKLTIQGMQLVVNPSEMASAWPPAVRELRQMDLQVTFQPVSPQAILPGPAVTLITINADIDTSGTIQGCYTAWDTMSASMCADLGGSWYPNSTGTPPNRCVLRDVVADYACEEMGGLLLRGGGAVRRGTPTTQPGRGTPLPGDPVDNPIGPTGRVCDLSEVTKRDACAAFRGVFTSDAGLTGTNDRCSIVNVEDLRQMACTMAGGGSTSPANGYTTFSPDPGAFNGSGAGNSYCQQTTFGACRAIGGVPSGDTNLGGSGTTNAVCTINCNPASTTQFGAANMAKAMCNQQTCTDAGGSWDNVGKRCGLHERVKQLACTTFGGTWTTVDPFTPDSGSCDFNNLFTTMCTGIGGTWVSAPTNQCQIGGERYDTAMKRAACTGMARRINTAYGPGPLTYTAVAVFTPPTTCTIDYSTDFTTFAFTEANYKWKYSTESVGLFNGSGDSSNVSGGSKNVAIGYNAVAKNGYAIGIGYNADALNSYSVAIGYDANATTFSHNMALGSQSTASGDSSIAVGHLASATGYQAGAFGYNANASGDTSFASGIRAQATGASSTAIGAGKFECISALDFLCLIMKKGACCFSTSSGPVASGSRSNALGFSALASGSSSTAVGAGSTASGTSSLAIGDSVMAAGSRAIAIGNGATVSSSSSNGVAIGYNAGVGDNVSGTALGNNARAQGGNYTVSIGTNTTVSSPSGWAIAVGADSNAAGYQSTAVGDLTFANGDSATMLGAGGSAVANSTSVGANCDNGEGNSILLCSGGGRWAKYNGGWSYSSSRKVKEHFVEMDSMAESFLEGLMELPLYRWNYKGDAKEHSFIGPMAEDFHQAFGLGTDDTPSFGNMSILMASPSIFKRKSTNWSRK